MTAQDWFTTSSHLGGYYPYYVETDKRPKYTIDIRSAIERIPVEKRRIDSVGIAEVLLRSYLFGNRTLVNNVQRVPWMGHPDGKGGLKFSKIPEHGVFSPSVDEVALKLKPALQQEALAYVDGKKTVGILLSGGMDSRILAGIIRELQLSSQFQGGVVAFTWGVEKCRDVKYAREISKRFGWDFVHLQINADTLRSNIYIAGEMGAEFSPFHLHAMPSIAKTKGIDVVLAASYGDMVGRAEFSGRHLLKLRPIVPRMLNRYGLLRHKITFQSRDAVFHDAYGYRKYVCRTTEYQYRELEYHIHYTRRLLSGAMSCIGKKIPLFQLFTSPETFSLMWQLSPYIRDDRFYLQLLKTLPGRIYEIPWARTGRLFGANNGPVDNAPKKHHHYGTWARQELQSLIISLVDSERIKDLRIFNDKSLVRLLKIWPRATTNDTNSLDDIVTWLASLAVFVERFNIQDISQNHMEWHDNLNTVKGLAYAWTYLAVRDRFR